MMTRLLPILALVLAVLLLPVSVTSASTVYCAPRVVAPTIVWVDSGHIAVTAKAALSGCTKGNPPNVYNLTGTLDEAGTVLATDTRTLSCWTYFRPACGTSIAFTVVLSCADDNDPATRTLAITATGGIPVATVSAEATFGCHEIGGGD